MRAVVLLLIGCSGDGPPTCDVEVPASELPTVGPLIDPYAFAIADCVDQGLVELPGRWHVVNRDEVFSFHYPKFEGSCQTNFRRANYLEEDHEVESGDFGRSFHTWSDGTRFMTRSYLGFNSGEYEYASVFVACVKPDGTLAGAYASFDPDHGERVVAITGTRFEQKEPALAKGLSLVGELGTSSIGGPIEGLNLVIDGDVAYVAGALGFDVIDVSDPSRPRALGHVDGNYNDVRLVRSANKAVAYLADRDEDLVLMVDVTNPAQIAVAGTIDAYSHSLQVVGTRLYFGNYTESVPIYDVTNPLSPVLIGTPTFGPTDPEKPGGVHDLTVDGDRIYAYNTTRGVYALDVASNFTTTTRGSHPTTYSHAGAIGTIGGRKILLHGDEGMTPTGGAFMRILDADDTSATFMQEIARYTSRPEVGIHNIELVGDKAYIAYYQDGVRIVDLANPAQPREIAHYNTYDYDKAVGSAFEGALGIRVANGLVWVADLNRGLLIFRED